MDPQSNLHMLASTATDIKAFTRIALRRAYLIRVELKFGIREKKQKKQKKQTPVYIGYHQNHINTCATCRVTESPVWRKGWRILDYDQFANLCNACGIKYRLQADIMNSLGQ